MKRMKRKTKLMLNSTKVEVVVEFGNMYDRLVVLRYFHEQNSL